MKHFIYMNKRQNISDYKPMNNRVALTEEPQAQNPVSSEERRNHYLVALPKRLFPSALNCKNSFSRLFLRSGPESMPKNVMCFVSQKGACSGAFAG